MIEKLIHLSFRRRHIAWGAAILFVIFGYISSTQMKIEAYPELDDVTVSITTQVPGLAAEEMEQQITIPLEESWSAYLSYQYFDQAVLLLSH